MSNNAALLALRYRGGVKEGRRKKSARASPLKRKKNNRRDRRSVSKSNPPAPLVCFPSCLSLPTVPASHGYNGLRTRQTHSQQKAQTACPVFFPPQFSWGKMQMKLDDIHQQPVRDVIWLTCYKPDAPFATKKNGQERKKTAPKTSTPSEIFSLYNDILSVGARTYGTQAQ